ncbi:MAG: tRNA 2-thiouridine(34) synthase MnmA [Firmicutes bacterium]|nr:tRNA 2-thiouridine(34) synthase MnmA [Bacillota bacterium]
MKEVKVKRVNLGMSGGVDSSVAAYLLKQQGYDVHGINLYLCEGSVSSTVTASFVAHRLGIDLEMIDKRKEFREEIMEYFVSSYENAITPNPCVRCNRLVKFNWLMPEDGYVATGHYARITQDEDGRWLLRKADNLAKDQSYFLYSLSQEVLSRTLFPLADYSKDQIRAIADTIGLPNAQKKDSQDVCFIPDGDYARFITEFRGHDYPEGNFVDMDGNVLGRHKGIIHYTVGQRKGLGLALKKPMYVYRIDPERNEVVLGDDADLMSKEVYAKEVNWIAFDTPPAEFRAKARIRYRHKEADCTVIPLGKDEVKVIFDEPQRAVTAGQSLVIYDEDIVIGGGIIWTA